MKICDFGNAIFLNSNSKIGIGTILYSAPECHLNNHPPDESVDVWSIGMIIVCILFRTVSKNMYKNLQNYKIFPKGNISQKLYELLKRIFVTSIERIKISELKNHEFFKI